MLGADALVEDEGTYKPDFSAHAGSERLRCVRISKASFDTITSTSTSTQQEGQPPADLRTDANGDTGNGGGRKSGVKLRAFSDEGSNRYSAVSKASSDGVAGGVRINPSPPKVRRGLPPSQASLKILQAATGGAVIPSATTPTQDVQPDKPPEMQETSPGRDAGACAINTTGLGSPSSGRAARVGGDLESGGGPHQDDPAADASTPNTARI